MVSTCRPLMYNNMLGVFRMKPKDPPEDDCWTSGPFFPLKRPLRPRSLTASLPLENDGWNTSFLLGWLIFRDYVKLRGGTSSRVCYLFKSNSSPQINKSPAKSGFKAHCHGANASICLCKGARLSNLSATWFETFRIPFLTFRTKSWWTNFSGHFSPKVDHPPKNYLVKNAHHNKTKSSPKFPPPPRKKNTKHPHKIFKKQNMYQSFGGTWHFSVTGARFNPWLDTPAICNPLVVVQSQAPGPSALVTPPLVKKTCCVQRKFS